MNYSGEISNDPCSPSWLAKSSQSTLGELLTQLVANFQRKTLDILIEMSIAVSLARILAFSGVLSLLGIKPPPQHRFYSVEIVGIVLHPQQRQIITILFNRIVFWSLNPHIQVNFCWLETASCLLKSRESPRTRGRNPNPTLKCQGPRFDGGVDFAI